MNSAAKYASLACPELLPKVGIRMGQIQKQNLAPFDMNCFDKITAEELKYLARCVELLRDQTQTNCEKKMKSFIIP